jgi:hypothetical protein
MPLDYGDNKTYPERFPGELTNGTHQFSVLLYEVMWCQKPRYTQLPIPFVLHKLINLLKERNALRTEGVFHATGNEDMVSEITARANTDINALERGDVHVLATLLKNWLTTLPNPPVSVELLSSFVTLSQQNKFLGFIEYLPQVHQLSLTYLIGVRQAVIQNSKENGIGKVDLGRIFGPCIRHQARSARTNPEKVQQLTELSVALCNRLLEARDARIVYPLNPAYVPAPEARTKAGRKRRLR